MISNCYSAYDIEFMKQIAAEKLGCAIENVSYKVSQFSFSENKMMNVLTNSHVHFLLDYVSIGKPYKSATFFCKSSNSLVLTLQGEKFGSHPYFSEKELYKVGKFVPLFDNIVSQCEAEDYTGLFFHLFFLSFYAGF